LLHFPRRTSLRVIMACELILALDLPRREIAAPLLRDLRGKVSWIKIGLQMFTAYGPDYVREVADQGYRIFLDLKLHDIPHTVAKAVESLADLPIGMLTVHTLGGPEMLAAAREAQRNHAPELQLLGVTMLTSMDANALRAVGLSAAPAEQVDLLARMATTAGLDGFVCSPQEVGLLAAALPGSRALVTPGIRSKGGSGGDDQKRVMTPAGAARAGATHIVVGRPILAAADPAAAALAIQAELSTHPTRP
jgi:orotidine-5'-phosphate decarboxylase